MGRLTRAEVQELNRRKVLEAACEEFGACGFRDAKIDRIAERAGLTRGAVYSNFPGKRALYFAVLADLAVRTPTPAAPPEYAGTVREALGALARVRVSRFPLTGAPEPEDRLAMDLPSVVLADTQTRQPYGQLLKLHATVLGLALEHLGGSTRRLVPMAETVLTLLHGADQLAAAAPGFVDPFQVVAACEQLAELAPQHGEWAPPHLPYVPKARPVDEPWAPPAATDALRGETARLADDGVVAVLGLHRLEAAEEAVRAAAQPRQTAVTVALVTGEPGELGPLARLTVADLGAGLRQAFPRGSWPPVRIVHDESGAVAAAVGVSAVSDATETAVRIAGGRIVARAEGRGACHAAAGA
ncbi:TetR/AcrR family transcriptional regulator [Streptomyces candidus]|uniref:AcrR family transcriptional regulator n=1 Tax=Streptomyces candidus TaxID=67283 RepID=A0A7X0LQ32_9ACTN|nr:TetR/AcrR family transcriptional regulator [Streptomyces candidus]MBB6436605.1 AcrR family transcriptional regulator [Streptomyces candidus]GHH50739.1 TetR family transcriptional regulator [Streptomyces candidus]